MDRIDDELDSLRQRAYGPDADIWSDPAALARLGELETEAHRSIVHAGDQAKESSRSSPADADAEEPPAHDVLEELFRVPAALAERARRGGASAVAVPDVGDDAAKPEGSPSPENGAAAAAVPALETPQPPALSPRKRVAWAMSLVAAVVLAAGATAWLYPYGVRDGLHHIARLQVQSQGASAEVIAQLGTTDPAQVRYFGDYKGLPIYATTDCLQAVMDPERGAIYGGCAVDGIDPILDLYVPGTGQADTSYTDMQFPKELTRDFPDGGLVRFQLHGDEVLVDEGRHPKQA